MSIIGRREFELVMKMDDQTKREREALNKGLGDIERTTKKAAAETKRSIIDVAKQSKQGVEGIKAVMELGGWLMLANGIAKGFADITKEARASSTAFKEAGATLDVIKGAIGTGMVKALEPLVEGFTTVLLYGAAIFRNFPEVAKASFDFVKAILARALSWEGIKGVVLALGEGIITVFRAALSYVPKLFAQVIQLLLNPIFKLGEYIADTLGKAFTLRFDEIESPISFMGRVVASSGEELGKIAKGAATYMAEQASTVKSTFTSIGSVFSAEGEAFATRMNEILGPTLTELRTGVAGKLTPSVSGGTTGTGSAPAVTLAPEAIDVLTEGTMAGVMPVVTATKDLSDMIRNESLSGQRGLGAAVSANLSGTELFGGMSGGPLAAVFGMLGKFMGSLQNLLPLLSPLQTIFDAMMEVLGPVINNLLAPMVGILKIVGYLLGKILVPVLELLRPAIQFVAELFVWLFNKVLLPIGNGLIGLFNIIYNGFATFVNGILWLIDQIPFVDVGRVAYKALDSGMMSAITTDTLASTGAAGSSGAGGSASYAAGTSITVEHLEIRAEVIAGDRGIDEVALMFRDRILELEGMGR